MKESRKATISMVLSTYLFLVVVSILLFLLEGDDIAFHLQRLDAVIQEVRHFGAAAFPIRLYHSSAYAYGYASPLFYGDIFMWPFAALAVWLNLSVLTAYKIMLASAVIVIWLMTRFSFGLILKGRERDIAVFLYMVSVTIFDDMTGSWVGRNFAAMFVPLCLCSFCGLVYSEKPYPWKYGILLALGVTGLIYSNMLDAAIVVFSLSFIFIFTIRDMNGKKLLTVLAAALLCLGLSAWFLFPMVEQMYSQTFFVTSEAIKSSYDLYQRTVPLIGLILPDRLATNLYQRIGLSVSFRERYFYGMPFYLALILILARREKELFPPEDEKRRFYFCAACLLLLFMVFQTKLFPHPLFAGLLNTMQFPWRVNIVMTCLGALLVVRLVQTDGTHKLSSVFMSLTVVLVLLACADSYGFNVVCSRLENVPYADYSYSSDSLGAGEYLPAELLQSDVRAYWKDQLQTRGTTVLCDDKQVKYDFEKDFDCVTVSFSQNDSNAVFELPLLYYKGYSALDSETGRHLAVEKSENGLVSVAPKEKAGTFRVFYEGTALQKASEWCSSASALIMITGVLIKKKRRRATV